MNVYGKVSNFFQFEGCIAEKRAIPFALLVPVTLKMQNNRLFTLSRFCRWSLLLSWLFIGVCKKIGSRRNLKP